VLPSVFGELGVRKFWVTGRTLLASNSVEKIENGTGFERGRQIIAGGLPGLGFGPGDD